jgi:hypothetical protein
MHQTKALILAALGALALIPAAAAAVARSAGPVAQAARVGNRVILYKSIGDVGLGLTPTAVKQKLGEPGHTVRVSGKIAEFDYYGRDDSSLINVDFDTNNPRDPADGVFGFASSMHTSQGIHPGSTVTQLKHAYGSSLHKFRGGFALYKGKPGSTGGDTTQFGTFQHKVAVIDVQTTFNDAG